MFRPWEDNRIPTQPQVEVPVAPNERDNASDSDIDVVNVDDQVVIPIDISPPNTPVVTPGPTTPCTPRLAPKRTPQRTPGRRYAKKVLSKDAQEMVLSLYNYFKSKGEKSYTLKTAKALKVGYSTVKRIAKRGVKTPKKMKRLQFGKIDGFMCDLTRRTIYGMYKDKQMPTISSLHAKLKAVTANTEYEFPYSEITLWKLVKSLGFRHRKLNDRQVIMESTRIAALRYTYLRRIHKCRSDGLKIVYLDETWYDTHDIMTKGWVDHSCNCTLDAPVSRGKRIIILHAGSEDGWVPGCLLLSAKEIAKSSADYHEDMTAVLFEKWFSEQLLKNLPHGVKCAIVMDNASYHSRLLVRPPTSNTKKQDMLNFMKDNNINIPNPIPTRPVLLQLVRAANIPRRYVIDQLAAENGHQVVRLPPYYCVFNPIELIWSSLKRAVRRNNKCPGVNAEVVDVIRQEQMNIGSELWRNCIRHTYEVEKSYSDWDNWHDNNNIVINLQDDSDSSASDYDE